MKRCIIFVVRNGIPKGNGDILVPLIRDWKELLPSAAPKGVSEAFRRSRYTSRVRNI